MVATVNVEKGSALGHLKVQGLPEHGNERKAQELKY